MNNSGNNQLRIRPRFRQEVDLSPEEIKEKLKPALDMNRDICRAKIVQNLIILSVPPEQQHYWSPQLSLELEKTDSGTMIRGLYGPKPAVWTMFVFFYSGIGFLTLLGLIFGLSQQMLKMEPWALWFFPLGIILIVGFFLVSKIGQGLGQKQMHELKNFVDGVLGT
jgi:hypothetical protein